MFIRQGNEWQPIGNEKEDVAVLSKQILGLDYDNFKRTIIIPQNQFREFLELSPRDRTKMMNQLFKLDQYDLAGRVSKLSKANDNQLAELRGLLSPLEAVTPEAIEQANADIAVISESLVKKDAEINLLAPDEKRLLGKSETKQNAGFDTTGTGPTPYTENLHIEQREQDLSVYETCLLVFQADFSGHDKLSVAKVKLTELERTAQQQLISVTKRLVVCRACMKPPNRLTKPAMNYSRKLTNWIPYSKSERCNKPLVSKPATAISLTSQLNQQTTLIERHKAARAKHQLILDNGIGRTSDLERLYKVKNWFTAYKPLKKQADDLEMAVGNYDRAIEKLKQQKNDALVGFPPDWTDLTLKTLPDAIEEALAKFKEVRQERENRHRKLLVQDELRKYADALNEGQPCPLCGSTHHPNRHKGDEESIDVKGSEAGLQKVIQRIEVTSKLQLTIKELTTKLRSEHDNGKRLIQERTEIVRQLTEHEDNFMWPEFSKEQEGDVVDGHPERK